MAKLYPPAFPEEKRADPAFRAEALVYDELAERLPDPWVIFYDVAIVIPHRPKGAVRDTSVHYDDGQADFVVAHPDHGFLVLEVKGGGIQFEHGSWFSRNRDGLHPIKDPFRQATSCKHALYQHLCNFFDEKRLPVPSAHGVIFPDVAEKTTFGVEAIPDLMLVEGDWDELEKRLLRMLQLSRYGKQGDAATRAVCIEGLEKMLTGRKSFEAALSVQIAQNERIMRRLTERQLATLNQMSRTRKLVVSGCAGSGKTALAMMKARQMAREGGRVLLTCYNQKLADWFRESLADVPGVTAVHFHGLCRAMARAAEVPLVDFPQGRQSEVQEIYHSEYPMALEAAMQFCPSLRFDAVIVDEGQDFPEFWWKALVRCLADDDQGLFYWLYDERQAVYQRTIFVPPYDASLHLEENLRNTREIHTLVAPMYDRAVRTAGPSGPPLRWAETTEPVSLYEELGRQVTEFVQREKIDIGDIVVLTPHAERHSKLFGAQASGFSFVGNPAGPYEVLVSTIHSFKGLERAVVILAELDDIERVEEGWYQRLIFLGASRARQLLSIIASPEVLRFLRASIKETV